MKTTKTILVLLITINLKAWAFPCSEIQKSLQNHNYEVVTQNYFHPREHLAEHLSNKQDIWIIAPLADSLECDILSRMNIPYFEALSYNEYRTILLENGFAIVYSEAKHDSLYFDDVELFKDWLKNKLALELGLAPAERLHFAEEFLFLYRPQEKRIYFPYKELILHVRAMNLSRYSKNMLFEYRDRFIKQYTERDSKIGN